MLILSHWLLIPIMDWFEIQPAGLCWFFPLVADSYCGLILKSSRLVYVVISHWLLIPIMDCFEIQPAGLCWFFPLVADSYYGLILKSSWLVYVDCFPLVSDPIMNWISKLPTSSMVWGTVPQGTCRRWATPRREGELHRHRRFHCRRLPAWTAPTPPLPQQNSLKDKNKIKISLDWCFFYQY